MKFNTIFTGFALLLAMALPVFSEDNNTFEKDVVAKASNLRGRQLDQLDDKVDGAKAEVQAAKAEIEAQKQRVQNLKAECKPLRDANKLAKKTYRDADKKWRKAKKEDKPGLAPDRAEKKLIWDATKGKVKTCTKTLKDATKALRKMRRRINNKRKKLKRLRKRQRQRRKRRRRRSKDVKKELVAGKCVADHICATIRGDPHITTFDGLKYDCQGEGEFVLAKAINSESSFEIQGRFKSTGKSKMVSITQAISIDSGVDGAPEVDIYTERDDSGNCALYYYVNGAPFDFSTPIDGISYEGNGDKSAGDRSDYLFFTGSGILFSTYAKNGKFGCVLNSKLCLPPSFVQSTEIVGLLGTPDKNKFNDWTTPTGESLSQAVTSKAVAYDMCTTHWCVRDPNKSLFGYLENTTHATYFNCDVPYDNSLAEQLLDPPDECIECCSQHPIQELYFECIEECTEAEDDGVEQCVIDMEDAVVLSDVEKKCKDPVVPEDPDDKTPEVCEEMKLNKKCDDNGNRLFRSDHQELKGCQKQCADTEGCEFYSYAEEGTYAGVCMGCKSEADAHGHTGFVFYPKACHADDSNKDPEPAPEDQCKDMRVNVKCPYKHDDRLYREEGQSLESCHKMCVETEGCDYYSFGHEGATPYENVCMGCTSDVHKEDHTGFNLYSVKCLGDKQLSEDKSLPTAPKDKGPGTSSGDPHFKTWTGDKFDYHGECDLVLVNNPSFNNGQGLRVHIRTTRVNYFSYIEKVAVQIGADVLEFDNDVENFLINGYKVEAERKHHKTHLGGFMIRRDPRALSIRLYDEGRHHHNGHNVAKIDLHKRKNGFPAVIIDGGETEIFKGSTGLLGDWSTGKKVARDGRTEMNDTDHTAYALEWQVRDTEPLLFMDGRFPQYPTQCTPPEKHLGSRLGLTKAKEEAEKACAHWKEDKDDCVFDVIATRDVLVAAEGSITHVQ